ncbi:MAG: hypothetical protein ACM31L_17415 [Actinomycetota bacterium]
MTPEWACDTGPLISFERIPEGFDLLRRLAGRIIIPLQVEAELGYAARDRIGDFVEVVHAPDPPSEAAGLHDGERFAIALAVSRGVPLLIEERDGRAVAERLGLRPIGAVGLILDGWERRIVTGIQAADCFRALLAGRRISQRLLDALLERVVVH